MGTELRKKVCAFSCIVMLLAIATGCMNMDNAEMKQQGTQENRQGTELQAQGQDRRANNADDRIRIADRAAERIAAIDGVQQANVLVTERNAYVGAVLNDDQTKSSRRKLEDQIAKKVKQTDPDIQNVYVSTNPDFVDRINTYVKDVQEGRPAAGFAEQFNEMIQRVFPDAK